MAGASDKSRFFQEQSIPELLEYARKEIFTRQEIASISRKRSDFEYILNAPRSKPHDYARYIEYEMNLESLRRKRVKRLGVKINNHMGQRRIACILDRATKKFPADIGLWMQYVTFAQEQGSNKKVSRIITRVLRLHPTVPELWIHAASLKGTNMTEARSYMQRGLRLCGSSENLWIEYARLEMIYISKITRRRRILGLDVEKVENKSSQNSDDDDDEDVITLPAVTTNDIILAKQSCNGMEQHSLEKLSTGPILTGAIPKAIFDAAIKNFNESDELCRKFFDMITEFQEVPCLQSILSHMIDTLRSIAPRSPSTLISWIRQPVIGINQMSPDFPALFACCLDRIKESFEMLAPISTATEPIQHLSILGQHVIAWLLSYEKGDIDADIRKVMRTTIKKIESMSGRH